MPDLAILVPTRGRPGNIRKVIGAWDFTNAWDHADLVLIVDADDPELAAYEAVADEVNEPAAEGAEPVKVVVMDKWMPMVHKLNLVAALYAQTKTYRALGFAGDDHLPQTINWAQRYLTVLAELGSGMVYGDDGYQGIKLGTEWAVTADAVRALSRMVPAPVEHMYCDNSMMDLFDGAGAIRHLPEVRIEHMHPIVGKAKSDEQYERVNHRDQFAKDRAAYEKWKASGLVTDIRAIRALRPGMPDSRVEKRVKRLSPGSGPRRVDLKAKRGGGTMGRNYPFPRHFKKVTGATPDAIALTLADFAKGVPADQEIVELGVFQGRTALIMSWGARQGNGAHLTAIDPWNLEGNVYDPPFTDEGSKTWARYNVMALGYNNHIRLVQGFSHEVAAEWSGPPVALLFVDGDHTKEGAKRDIVSWAPHLAEGATIAVDDYDHADWPGVRQAVDELVDEGVLEPVQIFHDRLAVTRLAVGGRDITPDHPEPTAITSEGVSPSPYPAVAGQVAAEAYEPDAVDLLFDGPDNHMSTHPSVDRYREVVNAGELEGVDAGTPVLELNTVQLRALAKRRGIVLGARKDKRSEMIQALADGR